MKQLYWIALITVAMLAATAPVVEHYQALDYMRRVANDPNYRNEPITAPCQIKGRHNVVYVYDGYGWYCQ